MRPYFFKLAVAIAIVLLAATGFVLLRSASQKEPARSATFPITVVDDVGVTITVDAQPKRIVSAAPHLTETIFALGAGRRLVGVSGGETHPPEATAMPALVTSDGITPDAAAIAGVKPDLVVAAGGPAPWKDELAAKGLEVATVNAESVEDALNDITLIGRLLGRASQAKTLVASMRAGLRDIQKRVAGATSSVAFETSFPPPVLAGDETYLASVVKHAGGLVVGAPHSQYAPTDATRIGAADPDFYLASRAFAGSADAIKARDGFGQLRAVAEGRVAVVDDDLVFRPGPRLVLGVRAIALIIHPESFD